MPRFKSSKIQDTRRAVSKTGVIVGLVVLALIVFGGIYWSQSGSDTETVIAPILVPVERGEFVSQVLDQGEIQSSDNVEIRCQVRARNGDVGVLSIIPEGTVVSGGELLVRLDSTSFEKELEQQKVAVANAETSVIQAEADHSAAIATLKEYEQGVFVEQQKTIQNEVFDAEAEISTARQEITQAEAVLEHSKKLQNKGFITDQQLESDTFAVERARFSLRRAENSLDLAKEKLSVLEKITREKEVNILQSDIKAATIRLENQREAKKVELTKLAEITTQIENCEVRAPAEVEEGQVVYGKETSRGRDEWVLEEGASVRENQVMIRLPNPNKMEVKALVNEQSITRIRKDQVATIRVDAISDQLLSGIVTHVNQYAESSRYSSSVRKYAVLIRILNPPPTLKPGMNASCSIQVEYQQDVLKAPVQTVYSAGDKNFCLVKKGESKWETREIQIADDNSQVLWVTGGLDEGEELVMNPGGYLQLLDLPDVDLEEKIELSEQDQLYADKTKQDRPAGSATSNPPGGNQPGSGNPGGTGGVPPVQEIVSRSMNRYDTNSDGKIDQSETAAVEGRGKDMIARADRNGDGEVTRVELEAAIKARTNRGPKKRGPGEGKP